MDDDRRVYLAILKGQSEKYGMEFLGWCLMTNHVHLIGRPSAADSLARALGRTHFLYTQYINRFHGRSGHLWQNRFFSCPLGREHFWQALRYVEQNPLRAKMLRHAWKYPWSSAAAHVDGSDSTGLLNMEADCGGRRLARDIAGGAGGGNDRTHSHNTHTGRPLAEDSFISKVEKMLNKRLRPLPVGRPKKTENA